MKKRLFLLLLAVITAFAGIQTAAFAAPETETAEIGGTSLQVDTQDVFAGMNAAYRDGYSPAVENNQVKILLPLVDMAGAPAIKQDAALSVSVDLGDPKTAPFLFNNYDTTVKKQANPLADGGNAECYLIALTLGLSPERVNGSYSVKILVRYPLEDNTIQAQEFTIYVKITDGIDPNAPEPEPSFEPTAEPEPEPPIEPEPEPDIVSGDGGGYGGGGGGITSQPKIIVSNYTVTPETVEAGEPFTVTVTLKNTSKSSSVKNITATYRSQTTDLMSADHTTTAFIEGIPPQKSESFSFAMEARADAEAGPQKIDISINYEDSSSSPLSASDEITVEVHQRIRLEYDAPAFPDMLYEGDTFSASLNLYNKGKSTLYNVTVMLNVPGLTPESSAFLGNMESGTSKTADIYGAVTGGAPVEEEFIFEGEADAADGEDTGAEMSFEELFPEEAVSAENGSEGFIVTYEDGYGEEYELIIPVSTMIMPMPIYDDEPFDEGMDIEEEPAFPWWGWLVIAGGGIAAVIAIVTVYKKKKRARELEELEDDELS